VFEGGFLLKYNSEAPWSNVFSGFTNSAVIAIGAMFVLSRSLVKTGFLVVFADFMYKWAGRWKWVSIFIFLFIVSILSGLINNTAVVAIFIPFVIDICQRYHISPSKLLLPLSYAAIFGGTLTLIGTSTNLLVNSIIEQQNPVGIEPFGMFEFTRLGLIFLGVGTIYNIIVARWFIPSRAIVSSLTQKYHITQYITEYKVTNKSNIIGKIFQDIKKELGHSVDIVKIIRDKESILYNIEDTEILEGDVLIVRLNADNILKFKRL
jgi:di/tricarboxylate transporter